MAPGQPWGGAPAYGGGLPVQGYPPAAGATLQSAGALPPKKSSSATGIVAAIVAGIFFVVVVFGVGFCALVDDASSVEIGAVGPSVAAPVDLEATADLSMQFTPPGAKVPSGSMRIRTHRKHQVTVLAAAERRALRAEVHYSDASTQTTGSNGSDETENSPVANRTFVVQSSGGTLTVSASDGGSLGDKERAEVLNDVGALFKPRPAMFTTALHVGDALTPSSEAVIDLLGLASTDEDITVRADNASFKLQSIAP